MKKGHLKPNGTGVNGWGALRIALIYLLIGGLWIIFSDRLALAISSDIQMLARINLIKGWGYVLITAALLFFLVFREMAVLQASETRYRLLAEHTADVIWILDIETMRFLYVSPSVERLRGYTMEEVLSQSVSETMPRDSYQMVERELPQRISAFLSGDPQATTQVHEVEQVRRDGSTVWTEVVTTILRTEKGKLQVLGVSRDISARKQAEETLRRNDELMRLAYDAADLGTWKYDIQMRQITIDKRACKHFGFDTTQVSLEEFLARVYPEDLARLRRDMVEIIGLEGNGRYRAEVRITHPNSEVHWLEVHTTLYYAGEGAARRAIFGAGTSRDITEQKNAEIERRVMEERMRLSIQASNIGFYDFDIKKNTVMYSLEWKRQIGYEDDEISDSFAEWQDRLHPDDLERVLQGVQTILNPPYQNFAVQFRLRHKDGSYRSIVSNGVMIFDARGEPERVVGTHLDLTVQKQVEERLRRSESALKEAQRLAHIGSWIWDMKADIVEWSDETYRIYGIDKEHFTGSLNDVVGASIHPEDMPRVRASHEMAARNEKPTSEEYRIILPDGRVRWVWSEIGDLVRDADGTPAMVTGTIQDITEKKQADERIKAAMLRLQSYFDADLIGIMISEKDGTIIEANDYYLNLIGRTQTDLASRKINWRDFTPEEFWELDDRAVMGLTLTGRVSPYEKQYQRKDGTRVWILVSKAILLPEEDKVLAFVMEITERKQAEEELRRLMEELKRSNAELEQFAYVASHDLQEPLRTVAGMVQLLQQRYQGQLDDRADEYIQHAVNGTVRMQTLINDLLVLSRVNRRGRQFERIESGEALQIALDNLAIAIRDSGAVITHDPMPALDGDETQLAQVFQNIIGNAIKFRGAQVPAVHIGANRSDGGWLFSIRDNGIGIEAQYFERIFAPFQRLHTRQEYLGNGIGLAICKKIVERHGGRIWVESTPGQGSVFFFTLPDVPRQPGPD